MSIFSDLSAPFPADAIHWRAQSVSNRNGDASALALAYIDARDVMERLDEVCGPAGWQCTYPHANGKTVCSIGIKIGDEWVWKANGAGDTDIEAEKGALSDAFKRAAVCWGIGRYLYDLASPWVVIEPAGRSYRIPDAELARLARVLGPAETRTVRIAPGVVQVFDADEPTESERKTVELFKAAIDMAKTGGDLADWKRTPSNVRLFGTLPPALRQEVADYAAAKMTELQTPQSVLMAG